MAWEVPLERWSRMNYASHLPRTDPRVLAVGVAALLAGAGGALGVAALADHDSAPAPVEVQLVPASPAAQPTNLGPGSGCFPKYGCTE